MRDIDAVIDQLLLACPGISVEQLTVLHPGADDDGLWFFRLPMSDTELQLESTTGNCPFLMESSATVDRLTVDTVAQAVAMIIAGFGFTGQRPGS
jgi:hypothetical protein